MLQVKCGQTRNVGDLFFRDLKPTFGNIFMFLDATSLKLL